MVWWGSWRCEPRHPSVYAAQGAARAGCVPVGFGSRILHGRQLPLLGSHGSKLQHTWGSACVSSSARRADRAWTRVPGKRGRSTMGVCGGGGHAARPNTRAAGHARCVHTPLRLSCPTAARGASVTRGTAASRAPGIPSARRPAPGTVSDSRLGHAADGAHTHMHARGPVPVPAAIPHGRLKA